MGKGLFVLFLVFSRWFWFPSSVPPCWQSSLPQGLALCCGACVLGDRADVPPMLFFFGGSLSDGLSWHAEIPRCCFVLYSLSCGAGFFLLPKGFSLPRISLHFLDTSSDLCFSCGKVTWFKASWHLLERSTAFIIETRKH